MQLFRRDPYKGIRISTEEKYGEYTNFFIDRSKGNYYKTIISGGETEDRNRVLLNMITMAWRRTGVREVQPLPMIILHVNNTQFEQVLCRGNQNAVIRGVDSFLMDPLSGIDNSNDAATILYNAYNAATSNGNSSARLREAFKIGVELILMQGIRLSVSTLNNICWSRLADYIEELADRECLTPDEGFKLISRAGNVSDELYDAETFLHELNSQLMYDGSGNGTIGLIETINRNGRVCINLRSNGNAELKELIAEIIKSQVAGKGKQFLLILDSVNIAEGDSLWKLTAGESLGYSSILAGADVPGMLGDSFKTYASGKTNVIAFAHASGTSSNYLADQIGQEYQVKVSSSEGKSKELTKITGGQRSFTKTTDEELRHIIPSRDIQNLPVGEAVTLAAGLSGRPYIVDFLKILNQHNIADTARISQRGNQTQLKG